MKYMDFDNENNLIARYDDEHNTSIPTSAIEVSDELFWQTISETDGLWKFDPETGEISKHQLPGPTPEQLAEYARAQRDAKIESVRWRIERHKDELELGNEPTEPLEPLLRHVQALRDVPAQAKFPQEIVWPIEP